MARTTTNKLHSYVRIRLPKQMRFRFASKHCQWWSRCNVMWKTITQFHLIHKYT